MSVKLWHNAKSNALDSKRILAMAMQAKINEKAEEAYLATEEAHLAKHPMGELQGHIDYLERCYGDEGEFEDPYFAGDLDDTDYGDLAGEYRE